MSGYPLYSFGGDTLPIGGRVATNSSSESTSWAPDTTPSNELWNFTLDGLELQRKRQSKNKKKRQVANLAACEAEAASTDAASSAETSTIISSMESSRYSNETVVAGRAPTEVFTTVTTKSKMAERELWTKLKPVLFDMPPLDPNIRNGEWIDAITAALKKPVETAYEFAYPPGFAPEDHTLRDLLQKSFDYVKENLIPEYNELLVTLIGMGGSAKPPEEVLAMFKMEFDLSEGFDKKKRQALNKSSDESVKLSLGVLRRVQVELIGGIAGMRKKIDELQYLIEHPEGRMVNAGRIPVEEDDFESMWGGGSAAGSLVIETGALRGADTGDLIQF